MLSFAHAVECNSREHKHEGTECETCPNAKYQDYTDSGAMSEVRLLHRAQQVPQPLGNVIVVRDTCQAGITRGPPLSS